ncbi:MAG: hypothetical protein FWC50_01690 [Planctomycetaceae bacterium]|nr:hypothetical protein [Planctomycetaceae bacterium]
MNQILIITMTKTRLFTHFTQILLLSIFLGSMSGCACLSDRIPGFENVTPPSNPMFISSSDADFVWDRVTDAVDDYFDIEHEEPIRAYGQLLTEGRIDTFPKTGATYLEPWFHDSVTGEEKLESTFQSIRRRALVRVVPGTGGFSVYVTVYKELEDLVRPLGATAGAASFTYTNSINTVTATGQETPVSQGWISMGRDTALEQRILLKIMYNLKNPPGLVN